MPKELVNNKIIYQNIYGRIAAHEQFLDQSVMMNSSPTFANLHINNDTTINGNLYVYGNTTVIDSITTEFEDNILLLNRLESGSGVTLHESGIEVDRGSLPNYRIIYNEQNKRVEVGEISNLQPVAIREDSPIDQGIMVWNDTLKIIESKDSFIGPLTISSTNDSDSVSTGTLIIEGGIGVNQNISIGGKLQLFGNEFNNICTLQSESNGNLSIISSGDINMSSSNIIIPYNTNVFWGSSNNISVDTSDNTTIFTDGHLNLNVNKRINIPNQIPITFSTINEAIYTDGSNNMIISGSQDIQLNPGSHNKVILPASIPIAFGDQNQEISANLTGDLTMLAGNNIFLTPGNGLNIRIPIDSGVKFGDGNQRISSDSNNNFILTSAADINFSTGNHINIPSNTQLTFGGYTQYLMSDTSGNFIISTNTDSLCYFNNCMLMIDSTENSISGSSGSINTLGGLGVSKNIYCNGKITIEDGLLVKNNLQDIFSIDCASSGSISILAGDGNNCTLNINNNSLNNAQSLIQLQSQFDTMPGYFIGRGKNDWYSGRVLNINLPSYSDYSNTGDIPKVSIVSNDTELFSVEADTGNISSIGVVSITNTSNATNSSAALMVYGGMSVNNDILCNGKINTYTNSTQAILVADSNENIVFLIDTNERSSTFNSSLFINNTTSTILQLNNSFIADYPSNTITNDFINNFTNSTDSTDNSTASIVLTGGMSINKKLRVLDSVYFNNTLDLNTTRIHNVQDPQDPQDAATKAYVDLVKQGLFVKDSVKAASVTSGNLSTDFAAGLLLDNYTLQFDDRILIKDQLNPIENGIYTVTNDIPLRSIDAGLDMSGSGIFVFVQIGDINGSLGWICNSIPGDDIIGINDIYFTQFTGLGQIDPGAGLSKNFNQINVNVDDSSLEIYSDSLRIKNTAVSTGITGGSGNPLTTTADQSHVTKLGTINTGTWQGSTIQPFWGGTGQKQFTTGSLLFGNGTNGLNTSNKLFFDSVNTKLGIGINTPSANLHIQNNSDVNLLLNSDSDGLYPNAKSVITFAHGDVSKTSLGITRNYNDIASNTYPESFVISCNELSTNSILQFATRQQTRLTILDNGFIGINCSTPSTNLQVSGTLKTTSTVYFASTTDSINSTSGSVIMSGGLAVSKNLNINGITHIHSTAISTNSSSGSLILEGGLSIHCNQNSYGFNNGGALTVEGGASFGGDVYIAGTISGSGSSSSTFAYLTLTSTDEAVNISSGSLVTFGGITIQCPTNSTNVSNGGALLVAGGASIGADMYINGALGLFNQSNYYGNTNNLINFYDQNALLRFSIDRNVNTNDLSISRYNASGTFIEKSIDINNDTGSITFGSSASMIINNDVFINSTNNSISLTSGALTVKGGIAITKNSLFGGNLSIFGTTESNSYTSGSITTLGGLGVSKNVNIHGELSVDNIVSLNNTVNLTGNGLIQTVTNNNSLQEWFYIGKVDYYTDIDFICGLNQNQDLPLIYGLKLVCAFNNISGQFTHNYYYCNVDNSNDNYKTVAYVFYDSANYHLFIQLPSSSTIQVNINYSTIKFNLSSEGTGIYPDGNVSGFNSWSLVYQTNNISTLNYSFGDVISDGSSFKIADNLPIIGYNNTATDNSRNLGIMYQKYQNDNDTGSGEVVSDPLYQFLDSIPNQSSASLFQIKLSSLANSSDSYYNGWWIKIGTGSNINQVRQIVSYNGAQRVAQLSSAWTTSNPTNGDTVYLYNSNYVTMYYDTTDKIFNLALAGIDNQTGDMNNYSDADLLLKHLVITDTTDSFNCSSGSIYTRGGVSIECTANAQSCTNGGTLTSLGGAAFRKSLFVGENIALGQDITDPLESLHIKQTSSTIRLENDLSNHSYIDFVESTNHFGILSDQGMFSFTFSTSGNNPISSSKAISINNSGFIGINTTNISNLITINENNYIATNSTSGWLGILSDDIGDSSKITLFANGALGSAGNIVINAGLSSGSVLLQTNNTNKLVISNSGTVNITSTEISSNSSTGSLVVNGGFSINSSQNSASPTQGGALTINGGMGLKKDLYIGGNLYISGSLNSGGASTVPILSFSDTTNCTIIGYDNASLLTISNVGILSFTVSILPTIGDSDCEFVFSLPGKTNALTSRNEVVIMTNGYSDDTNITSLFNLISVGISNTTNALCKFNSNGTTIHYINFICKYPLT